MLPFAGVIVVWSGSAPRHEVFRIPVDGCVLGREHADASDDRISRAHASVTIDRAGVFVRDLGSRNGTFVNSHQIDEAGAFVTLPAIVRTGRTVSIIVSDVRLYENESISRRGSLVVAGSLAEACRALDAAAIAEENVALFGTLSVGRALAATYAETIGGKTVEVVLGMAKLTPFDEMIAGATPRTIILVLRRPLTRPDEPELAAWLETDVRIACVARGRDSLDFMPKEMIPRLTSRTIQIPALRIDELPATIFDRVRARAPDLTVHATFMESVLLESKEMHEDALLAEVDAAMTWWLETGEKTIRGDDFEEFMDGVDARKNCYHGIRMDRRTRRARVPP